MIMILKQRKIKFKPRIKLNHNIYIYIYIYIYLWFNILFIFFIKGNALGYDRQKAQKATSILDLIKKDKNETKIFS